MRSSLLPNNLSCPLGGANLLPSGHINVRHERWADPLDFAVVADEEAVARLNAAGYFLHTLNGDIYRADGSGGITVQRPGGFNKVFACRQARYKDGKVMRAGEAWLRSSNRREYDHIGYWPDDHERPAKSFNLWQGWGVEPRQGDWAPIYEHILDVVARGDEDKADYILNWCAHLIQRPWEKPRVALILKGAKGTGKTLVTHILGRLIGKKNTLITADGNKLFERFNWQLADKLLIGAEEAFFAGDRALNDKLKHLLTGDEVEVEQKSSRSTDTAMHRVIMTSNHGNIVDMTDDERRFFVCDVSGKRRGDDAYFGRMWRIVNGEDECTLAAFMHELKTRDITNLDAR
jgi:hypothetical protein